MKRPRRPPGSRKEDTTEPPEAGCEVSFRERLAWQWICAHVRARGVPERDVDDVAQEVVIAMSQTEQHAVVPDGERPEDARRALLLRLVWQKVGDYLKIRGRRAALGWSALSEDMPEALPVPSAEDLAVASTPAALVRDAVALLEMTAPEQHAVVVAHDLGEVPMCEIAAKLWIRPATAWNRLRLGRMAVREALRRWAKEPT